MVQLRRHHSAHSFDDPMALLDQGSQELTTGVFSNLHTKSVAYQRFGPHYAISTTLMIERQVLFFPCDSHSLLDMSPGCEILVIPILVVLRLMHLH